MRLIDKVQGQSEYRTQCTEIVREKKSIETADHKRWTAIGTTVQLHVFFFYIKLYNKNNSERKSIWFLFDFYDLEDLNIRIQC